MAARRVECSTTDNVWDIFEKRLKEDCGSNVGASKWLSPNKKVSSFLANYAPPQIVKSVSLSSDILYNIKPKITVVGLFEKLENIIREWSSPRRRRYHSSTRQFDMSIPFILGSLKLRNVDLVDAYTIAVNSDDPRVQRVNDILTDIWQRKDRFWDNDDEYLGNNITAIMSQSMWFVRNMDVVVSILETFQKLFKKECDVVESSEVALMAAAMNCKSKFVAIASKFVEIVDQVVEKFPQLLTSQHIDIRKFMSIPDEDGRKGGDKDIVERDDLVNIVSTLIASGLGSIDDKDAWESIRLKIRDFFEINSNSNKIDLSDVHLWVPMKPLHMLLSKPDLRIPGRLLTLAPEPMPAFDTKVRLSSIADLPSLDLRRNLTVSHEVWDSIIQGLEGGGGGGGGSSKTVQNNPINLAKLGNIEETEHNKQLVDELGYFQLRTLLLSKESIAGDLVTVILWFSLDSSTREFGSLLLNAFSDLYNDDNPRDDGIDKERRNRIAKSFIETMTTILVPSRPSLVERISTNFHQFKERLMIIGGGVGGGGDNSIVDRISVCLAYLIGTTFSEVDAYEDVDKMWDVLLKKTRVALQTDPVAATDSTQFSGCSFWMTPLLERLSHLITGMMEAQPFNMKQYKMVISIHKLYERIKKSDPSMINKMNWSPEIDMFLSSTDPSSSLSSSSSSSSSVEEQLIKIASVLLGGLLSRENLTKILSLPSEHLIQLISNGAILEIFVSFPREQGGWASKIDEFIQFFRWLCSYDTEFPANFASINFRDDRLWADSDPLTRLSIVESKLLNNLIADDAIIYGRDLLGLEHGKFETVVEKYFKFHLGKEDAPVQYLLHAQATFKTRWDLGQNTGLPAVVSAIFSQRPSYETCKSLRQLQLEIFKSNIDRMFDFRIHQYLGIMAVLLVPHSNTELIKSLIITDIPADIEAAMAQIMNNVHTNLGLTDSDGVFWISAFFNELIWFGGNPDLLRKIVHDVASVNFGQVSSFKQIRLLAADMLTALQSRINFFEVIKGMGGSEEIERLLASATEIADSINKLRALMMSVAGNVGITVIGEHSLAK